MASTLDAVQFVFDENLLRLGRAVQLLRTDVALIGQAPIDVLLPAGTIDPDLIPVVGGRGWILVTNDGRIRTRPRESHLAIANNLKVVHLAGVGDRSTFDQAVRLLARWDAVEEHLAANSSGPWWASVQATGLRIRPYEPGSPART